MIQYFGFDYPPVGILGILQQVAPSDINFYILDPIGGQELPYHELDSDCWVIVTTNEGSSHRWFDRLIPRLQSAGVSSDHIIIRSACLWDPDSPVRHIHTIVDECSDFVTILKDFQPSVLTPQHHFVCLNNSHRWQRFGLVQEILNRGLQSQGRISYLKAPPVPAWGFPIVLENMELTWIEQRDIKMPALADALYNVICETAYEPQPGAPLITHHRPGMTEKSYKCFALFQVPIWLAPYRAVACYRELGFDVFDDVVDHSYDLELDPAKRIGMVADQVELLCEQSTDQLVQLKYELQPRFEHNWQRLRHYAHNFNTELPQWQVLFSCNNSN